MTSADMRIGELFDRRYRIERPIGSGGMAEVYLATDETLGRPVALKVLARRYADDPGFIERFRREATAAAQLNHPNIVSIYDRGEAEGTYYIAMEYLDGENLKQMVRRDGPFSARRAARAIVPVLDALAYAHRHGVIHRDIKPQNIIVTRPGPDHGEPRVKVVDFGIARAGDASQLTEAGSVLGTAAYLSPEQARGGHVTAASDLYSVGVVLYELLAGQPPFLGESAVQVAMRHLQEPPRPLREAAPGVSTALEAVVMRALAKDPAHRYGEAEVFMDDLTAAAGGAPVTDLDHTTATSVLGHTAATGYLPPPVAPVAPVAPLVYADPQPVDYAVVPPPPPPRRTPERSRWPWYVALALVLIALAALAAVLLTGGDDAGEGTTTTAPDVVLVALPDVVDLKVEDAVRRLTAAGFRPQQQRVTSDEDAGTVLDQDPDPGDVPRGSVVKLTVSAGPDTVSIPKVRGATEETARAALRDAGVRIAQDVEERFDDDIPEGRVIGTKPGEGEDVARNDPVTLILSKGAEKVTVPPLQGRTPEDAQRALADADLALGAQSQEPSDTVQEGLVVRSIPPEGTELEKGSPVSLVLSSGPEDVRVPETIGLLEDTAIRTLHDAGFSTDIRRIPTSNQEEDGYVLRQSPPAGRTVQRGFVVTIAVGQYQAPPPPPTTTAEGTTVTTPPPPTITGFDETTVP
jgi:serine/threonine-protein kinase